MSWTTLANTLFGVGKPVRFDLLKALRDNIEAATLGLAGSPVAAAAWHPYNRTAMADSATGTIFNFATDGALATVVTPDFVDGYEYQLRFTNVTFGAASLRIELFRETTGSYASIIQIAAGGATLNGFLHLPFVRSMVGVQVGLMQGVDFIGAARDLTNGVSEKATRARITTSGAPNLQSGNIKLYRRLAPYGG